MAQLLKKIQKIKTENIRLLEEELTKSQERELKPLVIEKESLETSLKQRQSQNKSMSDTRILFDEKKHKIESENKLKDKLLNEFVNEYFENLKKDDEKYMKLMSKYIEQIKSLKGKLTIDERTYNLFRSDISEDTHIVMNNEINGFKMESDDVEIIATLKSLKEEVIKHKKTDLNLVLFN